MRKEAGRRCLAAFDIGTTTIAGYLLDGADGRTLAVESRMNPQVQYGADVIMRANYALEHGTEALSMCVRKAVNEMLGSLAERMFFRCVLWEIPVCIICFWGFLRLRWCMRRILRL